jgi:hypothetical protein
MCLTPAAGFTKVVRSKVSWQCKCLFVPCEYCVLTVLGSRSDSTSGTVRLYDGRGGDQPLETVDKVHRFPVHTMTVTLLSRYSPCVQLTLIQYNDRFDCAISADEGGFIEYWQPQAPFELPKGIPNLWSFKTTTDLYEFKKVFFSCHFLS